MSHINKTNLKRTALFTATATVLALTACAQGTEKTSGSNHSSTQAPSPELVMVDESDSNEMDMSSPQPTMVMKSEKHLAQVRTKNKSMPVMPSQPQLSEHTAEKYQETKANPVHKTTEDAMSTFSIDTDTGSYANIRRFLNDGQLPPRNAIRYEELINYFNYDFNDAVRQKNAPFKVSMETVQAPWKKGNQIVKIAIKSTDTISESNQKTNTLPPSNLVFLVDVSGSMSSKDKLEMAKASLKMLTKRLRPQDTITMITYAGNTEIVLPPTSGKEQRKILSAITHLNSSGSTNGEAAIKLAYDQAKQNFKKDGINRILMLTDGDFNVGVNSTKEMLDIIKRNRDDGVSLSTFGFGTGNYNEHMMEQVANNGNGNYSYIDSVNEAKKALVDEMSSTFNTIAKDVKVQIEFNPNKVSEWRLIGYENRILADEDFSNDKVDAGELGAGKSVVALYEITPVGEAGYLPESRYQKTTPSKGHGNELGYLKLRYKAPQGKTSKLLEFPINAKVKTASSELKFAMAVTGYGQLLKDSKYSGDWTYADVQKYAKEGMGKDDLGTRHEFVQLVELAEALK